MTGMVWGALVGLAIGGAGFFAIKALSARVELPETKTVLKTVATVDLILFPVLGAFVGGLVVGE